MEIVADLSRMEINGYKMEVRHGGETIYFTFSVFNKNNFGSNNEIFKHINAFWKEQPPAFQKAVFDIYKEIDESFTDIMVKNSLGDRIKDAVKRLYELHPFETMKEWLQRKSGLVIPATFDEHYQEDIDRNTTEDKTYLRGDYQELMTLALTFRPMVPIWARFTKYNRQKAGVLKEVQSFQLLERTNIGSLRPTEKLLRYIKANLKKENTTLPVNFISDDDLPYWTMTVICVRKLCIGELKSSDPKANLVTLIHNFISAQSGYADGDFMNAIHTKTTEDFGGEENKISTMECFRINMDISVAESEEIPFSVENIDLVTNKVCIDLPIALRDHCINTAMVLKEHPIFRPQKALAAWVLKNAIFHEGIEHLSPEVRARCLGLVQAVLWHRGYKYLALLATAVGVVSDEHRPNINPTKERVTQDLQKELRSVYPHVRVVTHRKTEIKEECRITNDIEQIVEDLFKFLWQPTADLGMIKEVMGPDAQNRRLHIRSDIRIQLTKLAIDIGRDKISNPF